MLSKKNLNKNKKTIKNKSCAPNKSAKYSCYDKESLLKLKKFWNIRHPDNKITSNIPYHIWKSLKSNMYSVCDTESCWLKQKFIENNLDPVLTNYTFSPNQPQSWNKNKNEWLSSIDITKVMKQYEYYYKNFVFIGPTPIDFDNKTFDNSCVWDELCKFNLKKHIKNNKNLIGIIFNLDPHYKGGSHWVSLIIDISKKMIYYFDSNGYKIPKQIKTLVNRVIDQGNELDIVFTFSENAPKIHQHKNTECGIYSLYFITEILQKNKNYEYFSKYRISDSDMEKYRNIFFNKNN